MSTPPEWFQHNIGVTYKYGRGYADYEGWLVKSGTSGHPWIFLCRRQKNGELGFEEPLGKDNYHLIVMLGKTTVHRETGRG